MIIFANIFLPDCAVVVCLPKLYNLDRMRPVFTKRQSFILWAGKLRWVLYPEGRSVVERP